VDGRIVATPLSTVDWRIQQRHASCVGVATRLRARARERRITQLEHELAVADVRVSRIDAAETIEELRLAATPPPRSRRLPRAAIPAAAGAVAVAAAIAISLAVGDSSSRRTTAAPTPGQARAAAQQSAGDWTLANNNGVSIILPAGWANLEEDERGWSYAVIRDNRVRARIEVTPDVSTDDPAVLANRAGRIARRRAGYHEIRFHRETMNGEDAVRFDYLMREGGTKVRTESIFFIDSAGRGIGLFEQAPADRYDAWSDDFQRIRNSLQITPETMDLPAVPTPSG
jgi:hypothetical protein